MRLDYILYALAALILIITIVPFVVTIEGVETETRSLWVVATVVVGLLTIGLGYSQRPKTAAQACQPTASPPQATMPETQPVQVAMETPNEEKAEASLEKTATEEAPTATLSATATINLTHVKGIGEKRARQLKAAGINSVDDLANAYANDLAKKLKISPKITSKWIESAKELKNKTLKAEQL
jgi:predicted flap endonuclease-1-like 5' DNA nuclease